MLIPLYLIPTGFNAVAVSHRLTEYIYGLDDLLAVAVGCGCLCRCTVERYGCMKRELRLLRRGEPLPISGVVELVVL
jgi:hypothetical protein